MKIETSRGFRSTTLGDVDGVPLRTARLSEDELAALLRDLEAWNTARSGARGASRVAVASAGQRQLPDDGWRRAMQERIDVLNTWGRANIPGFRVPPPRED